jgi:hypothetical protein
MSQPKASKQKRRACAVPLLGAAGLSLSLASGASAVTPNIGVGHEITLGEEEISDVSLATFYVFDKENDVEAAAVAITEAAAAAITEAAAAATEVATAAVEAAATAGFGGEVAASAVEVVEAAATGAGEAASGSGALIDVAGTPWPGS